MVGKELLVQFLIIVDDKFDLIYKHGNQNL